MKLRLILEDGYVAGLNWMSYSYDQFISEKTFVSSSYKNYSLYQLTKFSQNLIREFQNKVNWHCISKYQKLSENFIREFKKKVNWFDISAYQKLSENFIKEFQNSVNWCCISEFQNLSREFMVEFISAINTDDLKYNQYISREDKNYIVKLKKDTI